MRCTPYRLAASASITPARALAGLTLAWVLAGLTWCNPAHAGQPEFAGAGMLECSGLPCVELSTPSSGRKLKMLIDTGNFRSILDAATAKELGLELRPFVGRDGKPRPGFQVATLKDCVLGERAIGAVDVLIMDLQPDIKAGTQPVADGSLAYTAFADRALRLDYKHHRVEVSEPLVQERPCRNNCGAITTPTFGAHGPPIVVTTGFRVNGQPITAQIDTLYTGTLLIYPTSVSKLGLEDQAKSPSERRFAFTDGGVKMVEGTVDTEGFNKVVLQRHGHVYFATADVHLPDGMFDGTVGHELFAGHVLTLDFHSHLFWIT